MKNVYSGQQIIRHVFKDKLSYVTLVKWCRKGILNPYHRTSSVGNVHDKSLFTLDDTVLAGVIKNIFGCGISHEQLLRMPVLLQGLGDNRWKLHRMEPKFPDNNPYPVPIPWRDMARRIQQFLKENHFKVVFRIQCYDEEKNMEGFCLEDYDIIGEEKGLLFEEDRGFSGAVIYINAKLIHHWVRVSLNSANIGVEV